MVDFVARYRLSGYKYTAVEQKTPTTTSNRDLYRNTAPHLFKTPRAQVHDCRPSVIQNATESNVWEGWLLSHGLEKTYNEVHDIHKNPKPKVHGQREPDKLLYAVGEKGSRKEQFNFPRSLTTFEGGDILIADSKNHRIQRYNQCGVFISSFGAKGEGPGQFTEPSGVAIMSDNRVVVVDRRNQRIQIFTESGKYKHHFSTKAEPLHVTCDHDDIIIVSTTKRTIEIYTERGKLINNFSLGRSTEKMATSPIAVNKKNELVVVDTSNRIVQMYSYAGKLLSAFEPASCAEGLACDPSWICLNHEDEFVIADKLNHTVNVYNEKGEFLSQIIGPTDNAGAVQACVVGPEGHLVVTEYSTNGEHCLKIFRYGSCKCHRLRPGSSKKSK